MLTNKKQLKHFVKFFSCFLLFHKFEIREAKYNYIDCGYGICLKCEFRNCRQFSCEYTEIGISPPPPPPPPPSPPTNIIMVLPQLVDILITSFFVFTS